MRQPQRQMRHAHVGQHNADGANELKYHPQLHPRNHTLATGGVPDVHHHAVGAGGERRQRDLGGAHQLGRPPRLPHSHHHGPPHAGGIGRDVPSMGARL